MDEKIEAGQLVTRYCLSGKLHTQPSSQLINPGVLVKVLQSSARVKSLLIQVGSHVLYTQAHISGSE